MHALPAGPVCNMAQLPAACAQLCLKRRACCVLQSVSAVLHGVRPLRHHTCWLKIEHQQKQHCWHCRCPPKLCKLLGTLCQGIVLHSDSLQQGCWLHAGGGGCLNWQTLGEAGARRLMRTGRAATLRCLLCFGSAALLAFVQGS